MSNQPPPDQTKDLLPPHSVEAEEALLGTVLINQEAMLEVAAFLHADDFYILRNGWVWEAMLRLHERGDPIDNVTLAEELRSQGRLDQIEGVAYLLSLINNAPTALHAGVYGRIIERLSLRRQMLEAASEIATLANATDLDVNQTIDGAESTLFAVTERHAKKDITRLDSVLSGYYDQVEFLLTHRDESMGIPTDFHDLDRLLGGFQKSDLIILAARPGMGKTSFGLNIAKNAARIGAHVAVFSLEMSKEQLVQRLVSSESGINSQKLRLGELTEADWEKFVQVVDRMSKLPIYLDDTVGITPSQLRTRCRRVAREHRLDLVIVDYLQLMNGRRGSSGNQNREQEISYISQALKELARELNIPVLSLAQLNRGVEQRADKRPMLSDLRESGAIEQNSDVVMFIYRDDVYNENTEFPNQAEIIVAKHRHGPTGTITLFFEKTLTQFYNLARERKNLNSY